MLASLLFALTFSTMAMSSALSLLHNSATLQTSYSAAFPPIRGISSSAIASYSYSPVGTGISASSGWKTVTMTIPTVVPSSGQQSYVASSSDNTTAVVISTTLSSAATTVPNTSKSSTSSIGRSSQLPSVQNPYTWSTTTRIFWTTQPSVAIPYTWSTTTRISWTTLPSQQIPNPFFSNSGSVVSTFTGDPNLSGTPPKATQQASGCEMEVCPPGSFDCHCQQSARAAPLPMSSSNLPSCKDVVCPPGSVDCCIES